MLPYVSSLLLCQLQFILQFKMISFIYAHYKVVTIICLYLFIFPVGFNLSRRFLILFNKLAKQGICIDKCSISVLCPAGQFLKSLRWGLPQSPVIASRAVRLCMSSGYFAVTGRNKKSEARLCRNIPVLPCLFSSVLLYFLLPIFRGLPLFFHLLAVEHFHVLSRLQKFLHLLLCFPVVPVRRLFL